MSPDRPERGSGQACRCFTRGAGRCRPAEVPADLGRLPARRARSAPCRACRRLRGPQLPAEGSGGGAAGGAAGLVPGWPVGGRDVRAACVGCFLGARAPRLGARPPASRVAPFRPAAARRRRARLAELSRSDLLPPWAAAGPAGRVWPARRSASSSRHPRGRFQRSAALPRPPLLHRLPLSYRANRRFSRTCLDPA